ALGTFAILGLPPFGVFTSEFMMLTSAMHEHSWATPFLLVALGVAFAAIFGKVQPMVFGERSGAARARLPHRPALIPVFVHLSIVLMLGLYVPPYLIDWYRQAARLIG
ncbi:MAG: hydrogenase 4 subunit F, partial [Burkholderiales bacterium]|nr:hydrogenase 4 subunit F [Burkholderiales bacterium]